MTFHIIDDETSGNEIHLGPARDSVPNVVAYDLAPPDSHLKPNLIFRTKVIELHVVARGERRALFDFDGVVLFAGRFDDGQAREEQVRRYHELHTVIDRKIPLIFLVPLLTKIGEGDQRLRNEFFRQTVISLGARWNPTGGTPLEVRSKLAEFEPFVRRYGTSTSSFELGDSSLPIAATESTVTSFVSNRSIFFLAIGFPQDHRHCCEIAASAAESVFEYLTRIRAELSAAAREFVFDKEREPLSRLALIEREAEDLRQRIKTFQEWKGLLCLKGTPLVELVQSILATEFKLRIKNEDKKVEDLSILGEDGSIISVIEVKGANRRVKFPDISQVDAHRDRLNLPETIPGLVIMNTLADAATLKEKDEPIDEPVIKRAISLNVIVMRTLDLIRLVNLVQIGRAPSESILDNLRGGGGWLSVSETMHVKMVKA